jgi:hypothetical protein
MNKHRERLFSVEAALPRSLSPAIHETLPVGMRISERLVDVLLLASELRADLAAPEAAPLAWIAPIIDNVLAETDSLLKRLSS